MSTVPVVRILRTYYGPSLYSLHPVILWTLDVEPGMAPVLADAASAAFQASYPEANPPLAAADADPILRAIGLMAAWAKELQNSANGLIDEAGATVIAVGRVVGWCGFHDERVGRLALDIAAASIASAAGIKIADADLATARRHFDTESASRHPGRYSRPLAVGARAHGIPYEPSLFYSIYWHYGWGRAGRLHLECTSNGDGLIGQQIARNKRVTREFLRSLGFPTAAHIPVVSADDAVAAAAKMNGPVVVKPANRGKGRGVAVGIESEEEIRAAFAGAREWSSDPILVERFVPGSDHRLLVIGGKLVAAARREPATVTGDGQKTVRQLIAEFSERRAADPVIAMYGSDIPVDATLDEELRRQGADLESIPASGVSLRLRGNANVSTGGTPTDVMPAVHPDVRAMAEAISRNAQVYALGIDYITTDITRSWAETGGAIIEINLAPGLDVHIISGLGEAEIGMAVLGDGIGRIPVAVVIAPLAEQAALLARVRAALDPSPGWRCGLLGNGEMTVGATRLVPAGRSSHIHVRQLLQNRDCDAALLCVTPNSVAALGFPVDRCLLTVLGEDLPAPGLMRALAARCSERVVTVSTAMGWPGQGTIDALMSVLGPSDPVGE